MSLITYPAAAIQRVDNANSKNPNQFSVIVASEGINNAYLISICTNTIMSKFFQRIRFK